MVMGFVIGSPSSLSSLSTSHSEPNLLYFSYKTNADKHYRKKKQYTTLAMASSPFDGQETHKNLKRRAFLVLGISVLPLLPLKSRALEALVTGTTHAHTALPTNVTWNAGRYGVRNNGYATRQLPENVVRLEERDVKLPEEKEKVEVVLPEAKQEEVKLPEAEEKVEVKSIEKEKGEEPLEIDASANPILSLLNGVGVFGSGVLGALYASVLQEKKDTEGNIESIKSKLKEKESAIVALEKKFESKLLSEQEEKAKQLKAAKEEQKSLMNQINSANATISGLGHELQREKKLIEELNIQLEALQTHLEKSKEDKKHLEGELKEKLDTIESLQDRINLLGLEIKDKEDSIRIVNSSIVEKESEIKKLNLVYEKVKGELEQANSEIKRLEEQVVKSKKEIESKSSLLDDLNARVNCLVVERDDSDKRFNAIQEEYNGLKLSFEKKMGLDAKLLGEKDDELRDVKEKLELALNELSGKRLLVEDLIQERDDMKKKIDLESSNVKKLKDELQISRETLGISMKEASDLSKQLKESRKLCSDLEDEVTKIQGEFVVARESLEKSLDEAKLGSEVLVHELTSVKGLLKRARDELQTVSNDLFGTKENRDSLQKELVDVYKKAENIAHELKVEKKIVATLNKELEALEKQILNRKSLERDLEEATKSLDEMNRNAFILTRDFEMANARISNLEEEKEVIYKSLLEQKGVAHEARENVEDAHNLVMRVGKEREVLEKRAKKLADELGAAKGEILRLRSQMNSSKSHFDDHREGKTEEQVNANPVPAKKIVRRRKSSSP